MRVGEHHMRKKPTEDEVDYSKQREECYKNTRLEVRHVILIINVVASDHTIEKIIE